MSRSSQRWLPVVLALGCSQSAADLSADSTAAAARGPAQVAAAQLDSSEAVALALNAFASAKGPGIDSFYVHKFQRDSAGAMVSVVPAPPPGMSISGGGGLVRITSDGRVSIVHRYR